MAKINKLQKSGVTIYPATIPQAVIDSETGKTQKEVNDDVVEVAKTLKQVEDDAVIKLINLITNGNFANGATGWRFGTNITETSVADSILSFIGGGLIDTTFNNWVRRTNETIYPQGHVLYNIVTARSLMGARFQVGIGYSYSTFDLTDQWEICSHLAGQTSYNFPVYGAGAGHTVEMTNAMCFDLTAIFGEGNEPTKEEMDELLAIVSTTYFEGEYALPISELNKWLSSRFPQKQLVTKEFEKIDNFLDFRFNNKIINSGFESDKNSWVSAGVPGTGGGSKIVSAPVLHGSKALQITNNDGVRRETQSVFLENNHKYYVRGSVYIESYGSGEIYVAGYTGEGRANSDLVQQWQSVSRYIVGSGTNYEFRIGSGNNYVTWSAVFDELVVCDLTEMFGAGNEPSKEGMDNIVSTMFAGKSLVGESAISQKMMFNYVKETAKPLSSISDAVMPLVTIANDDGRATDYELYQMMQRYGMRGTTFAVGTYVGLTNYLTEEQVKEMADAGWEIACHSYEHKNLTLETFPDGVIYQIFENKKFLEALTGKKVETLAHPFGGTNPEIRNLIRSFYEGARTSTVGYNDFGDVANVYNLKTDWTDYGSRTVEGIKSKIDALVSGKPQHLMLSGHALASEPGGDAFTLSEMEEVCNHLKEYQIQGKLEVVTFAEAVRRIKSHPNYTLL